MPAAVDEQPAPRKARAVPDHHRGDPEALAARAHELQERLQPAQDPPRLGGREGGFRGGDLEGVALVHAEAGEGGARRAVAADLEPGLAGPSGGSRPACRASRASNRRAARWTRGSAWPAMVSRKSGPMAISPVPNAISAGQGTRPGRRSAAAACAATARTARARQTRMMLPPMWATGPRRARVSYRFGGHLGEPSPLPSTQLRRQPCEPAATPPPSSTAGPGGAAWAGRRGPAPRRRSSPRTAGFSAFHAGWAPGLSKAE